MSPFDKCDLFEDPHLMDPDIDLPFATWSDDDVGLLLEIYDTYPEAFSKAKVATRVGVAWTYLDFVRKV